jgi:hypothetical protein
MNKVTQHYNRYGDLYTFEILEDGNIQWSGSFDYCRVGWPNDYSKAFTTYLLDGGTLDLIAFKEKVHESVYDSQGMYLGPSDLNLAYGNLITSDRNIIDMVDPSGGPYLERGDYVLDKKIINFRFNPEGVLIIVE